MNNNIFETQAECVKINAFELENVKRIKAVQLIPHENGLTVIGGKNGQGKTSVLDSIAWALGGDRFRPGAAQRDGCDTPPSMKLTLSNGLVVERKGKNSDLKVTDMHGKKHGQELLNSFVSAFALDVPRFMNASTKEKANTLLQVIGVGEQLTELERKENSIYAERTMIGREADRKRKYAESLPLYADVPEKVISIEELIKRQQAILAKNGENARKRQEMQSLKSREDILNREIIAAQEKLEFLQSQVSEVREALLMAAREESSWVDISTAEIEADIADIENTNEKVRNNLNRNYAMEDAEESQRLYDLQTQALEEVRKQKRDLLQSADLPLAGLAVENGELLYNNKPWDCMSGAEQLRCATAIVRKLNPACGYVLLDKLEQMDLETLAEFGAWLAAEGLQAIATRVSTGDECSVIIEDGVSRQANEENKFTGWEALMNEV